MAYGAWLCMHGNVYYDILGMTLAELISGHG